MGKNNLILYCMSVEWNTARLKMTHLLCISAEVVITGNRRAAPIHRSKVCALNTGMLAIIDIGKNQCAVSWLDIKPCHTHICQVHSRRRCKVRAQQRGLDDCYKASTNVAQPTHGQCHLCSHCTMSAHRLTTAG